MRIALIGLTHPFRGGIAHYTTLLCRALRERHDVAFLALFSWWHPFFAPAFGSVARLAARGGGPTPVFLCHNVVPHERSPADRALLAYAFSAARAFIVHAAADAAALAARYPRAKAFVSPHPVYEAFAAERDRFSWAGMVRTVEEAACWTRSTG